MPDQVLTRDGPVAAPMDYVVPQGGELLPLTVRATVDGTSAAQAFYAVVQIIAPSGRVMANGVSASIAAGASADVTWFPFRPCPTAANWPNTNHNQSVLAFGPWAYWTLNEANGSTTVADSSGHGRTCNASTTVVTMGARGQVPTSSDTCAYCIATSATNVTYFATQSTQAWIAPNITIEAWIAPVTGTGADESIVTHGQISSNTVFRWWLRLTNGKPVFITTNGGVATTYSLNSNDLRNTGTHQLVVVADGSHVTCYVDNVQTDQQVQTAALGGALTATDYINQPLGGAGARSCPGLFGPIAVYDQALTSANVASLWNAATTLS